MSTALLSNGGLQIVTPLQVVYLDFDGANTAYHGEILSIEEVTVQNSGLTDAEISTLTDQLNEDYWGSVRFVTERPLSGDYSTVYVGATDAFTYHGLSETIDNGNQNHNDNAFVNLRGDESLETILAIISHEVGHLTGTLEHGGDGLAAYGFRYDVLSGVTSTNVVLNNDTMFVSNGGVANNTTVNSSSYMYISSGGTVNNTTISGGDLYINSGAVANSTTVNSGGYLSIDSGGSATNVIWTPCIGKVQAYQGAYVTFGSSYSGCYFGSGNQLISQAMIMTDKVLWGDYSDENFRTSMYIFSGGVTTRTIVNDWSHMYISSGGIANSTTLNSGFLDIFSGGTANNIIANAYGQIDIESGGEANSTTVNSGGDIYISSGGTANSTTVNSGAYMCIESGGCAINVIWTPCVGTISVADGAYVTYQSNYSGCYYGANNQLQSQAMTMTGKIVSGSMNIFYGSMYIFSGGVANSTTVNSYGSMSVISGGSANSTTINQGYMCVSSGGSASRTIVNSHGYMCTFSGGVVNDTTVNYNGSMYVYSGGVANSTTVNSWGYMYISSGGSALNVIWTPCVGTVSVANGAYVTYQSNYSGCYYGSNNQLQSQAMTMTGKIISGSMYVYSGGTANNTTVSWGSMFISSGGTANSTAINNNGWMYIYSSGTANSTTVNKGWISISSGGTANKTILNSGGVMSVDSGGTANSTTVNSSGVISISSGGLANNTIVNSGSMIIFSGGTATNTSVNSRGSLSISSGGAANSTIINSGAMTIFANGATNNTIVNGWSYLHVTSNGLANSTSVNSAGYMNVSSGGTANNTIVNSCGNLFIASGGSANSTQVSGGMYVDSGGVTNGTTVNSGGWMYVESGGSAINVIWTPCIGTVITSDGAYVTYQSSYSGCYMGANDQLQSQAMTMTAKVVSGSMYIFSGGVANNTTTAGGWMYVESGGVANSTTMSGGDMHVSSGGTANNTIANEGVQIGIYTGGVANSTTVNSGGAIYVFSGGTANSTIVNSGGYLSISSGGSAINVIWTPCVGTVNAFNGAYVTYQSSYSGCYLGSDNQLQSQAMIMTGKVVSGSMYIFSGGTANSSIVNFGSMYISSAGVVNSTMVISYGSMSIDFGGVANNTVMSGGEMIISSGGTANNTDVNNGIIFISSGGLVNSVAISAGSMYISSGGTANNIMLNEGGWMSISSDGVANSNTLNYGYMSIDFGGIANNNTVYYGIIYISSGGKANNNTVNYGGNIFVEYGGVANNTTLNSDSYITVSSDGVANNTTVNSGCMSIDVGGLANSIIVNSGGWVNISSGSKVTGSLTIATEAVVSADEGAEINFDVSKRTTNDDYLINNLSSISGAPDYTITVLASQKSGIYKLAQGSDNFNQSISISNGATILGSLSANGTAVKHGDYTYCLLQNSGDLSLSVIFIDKVAPTISNIKANLEGSTNQNVLISVAFDDNIELALSQYKIGDGDWTNYTGAISVANNTTIYFKAIDTSGNETNKEYVVSNIDKISPVVNGIGANITVLTNHDVAVTASFSDDIALASKEYKIGNGEWINYTDAVTVSNNATIYFKAVDTAGNETTAQYEVKNILAVSPKGPGAVAPIVKVNKYDAAVSWLAPVTQDKAKVVSYEVYINGQLTSAKGTSLSLKAMPISVGNIIQIRALDSLGRYGTLSETISFDIKDVTSPILGKVAAIVNDYSALVAWSGSDNVGVDHYQVKCGDQTQALAGTSTTFENLAIGINNVEVIAFDAAGNASKAVTAKITVKDVTAPDPVTGLANPTVDSKYKATLSWNAGVDNSGSVASYEIQLDNGKILKSTQTTLAINSLAVGQHSYQVRAIDKAKNVGEWSTAKAFTVLDTTAPGTVSVKAAVVQNSIILSWKASTDNVGVIGYQVWIGASPSTMTMEQALSADRLSCVLTNVPKGVYYMDVRAIDAANNVSATKPAKVTVSTALPVSSLAMSSSPLDLLTWSSPNQTSLALASGL